MANAFRKKQGIETVADLKIDTSSLLTILGVVAAVWALLSPTSRLRLRYCMTRWDWCIGWLVFLLIHYIVFAPVLKNLDMYYSFGPWKFGLDNSSAVYLLLLSIAFYFFWRTKSPKLARGKVKIFYDLIENLHLTKRYDELVLLIEPQLPRLIKFSKQEYFFTNLLDFFINNEKDIHTIIKSGNFNKITTKKTWLESIRDCYLKKFDESAQCSEIIMNLISSPELLKHLAMSHPYFCTKLLETDEAIRSDFIERFVDTLLDNSSSRLYIELKNNQNLSIGSQLYIPNSNRLIKFLLSDPFRASTSGIDKAIGESLCRRLDEDNELIEKLNTPSTYYIEIGKFRCPIYSGITLFEIMVHEGIHQGLQDHLWLHYFRHFCEKMLNKITEVSDEEIISEYPTPYHFLLSRLVSISTDWTEQSSRIIDSEVPPVTLSSDGFDRYYISKQATIVLGDILQKIIPSKNMSKAFKMNVMTTVIKSYVNIKSLHKINEVADSYLANIISGHSIKTSTKYLIDLYWIYSRLDHMLLQQSDSFTETLEWEMKKRLFIAC